MAKVKKCKGEIMTNIATRDVLTIYSIDVKYDFIAQKLGEDGISRKQLQFCFRARRKKKVRIVQISGNTVSRFTRETF
jgi:hypothetical protein